MADILPQVIYSDRDYASFKSAMIGRIASLTPEWTNLAESDFGIVLIELFAHMGDNLAYYQDRQANEAFLATCQLRKSAIMHCQAIDYTLGGAFPATVDVVLTIVPDVSVRSIPAGSKIATQGTSTDSPVYFEVIADTAVPSNASSVTVSCIEGISTSEVIGTSNQTANQAFNLSSTSVIQPSALIPAAIVISVNDGSGYEVWTMIDSILLANPTDKVWYYSVDENDVVTIKFGDGTFGAIPVNAATIKADYRIGGGLRGNVGGGMVTVVSSMPAFVTACTNPIGANGGEDRETIDHARVYAPLSNRQQDRAVTLDDYQGLAAGVAGVAQVGAEVVTAYARKQVKLYIMPTGGGVASDTLLTEISNYLDTYKMAETEVILASANYNGIDYLINVTALPSYSNATVQTAVGTALATLHASGSVLFGQKISMSNVYRALDEVVGVDYLDITKMSLTPKAVVGRETGAGVPTFTGMSVSPTITREVWTIRMTSPTAFTVTGSSSGIQTATGTVGVAYTTDAGGLTFTMNAGTPASYAGDWWTIRTTPYIGDVDAGSFEVSQLGAYTITVTGGL
jgi:hypothetical protein